MTLEQFLSWEERQERKYEFDGAHPVATADVTVAHSTVQRNLITATATRLRGHRCTVHGSRLKIEVAGRIRYPDAFVVCTRVDPRATVVNIPVVVFEVLSESTAVIDLVTKNAEYRQAPSIQRYIVLQQTCPEAVVFAQASEWEPDILTGDAVISMPEIGIEVPLPELYEGLSFEDTESDA